MVRRIYSLINVSVLKFSYCIQGTDFVVISYNFYNSKQWAIMNIEKII